MLEFDDVQHILLTRTPARPRPAIVENTREIAPLIAIHDLDTTRLLDNVTTFNFHPHLPHYELAAPESDSIRVLGRQRVDPNRPHPFTAEGNTEFNALISMPPAEQRAGGIVLVDSTSFTTLFGGTESLTNFWHNLATMSSLSPRAKREQALCASLIVVC